MRAIEMKKPEDCFEVHGHFAEYFDVTNRCIGTRVVSEEEAKDWTLGYAGRKSMVITSPLKLGKKVIKASVNNPLKVTVMLQAICGKMVG